MKRSKRDLIGSKKILRGGLIDKRKKMKKIYKILTRRMIYGRG
jgi:hypothetical protein